MHRGHPAWRTAEISKSKTQQWQIEPERKQLQLVKPDVANSATNFIASILL